MIYEITPEVLSPEIQEHLEPLAKAVGAEVLENFMLGLLNEFETDQFEMEGGTDRALRIEKGARCFMLIRYEESPRTGGAKNYCEITYDHCRSVEFWLHEDGVVEIFKDGTTTLPVTNEANSELFSTTAYRVKDRDGKVTHKIPPFGYIGSLSITQEFTTKPPISVEDAFEIFIEEGKQKISDL